ncbi:MAG: hypothetical protein AAB645_01655 [Patescibacteria group bacterium]
MSYITLFLSYWWWHYTLALFDLVRNYFNFVGWLKNFFSLGLLVRTIFAPWRRMGEKYGSIFDAEQFFGALIVNTLMRLVGSVIKSAIIVFGLLVIFLSVFIFLATLILWLAAPIIIIFLFIFGIGLIIS